MHSRSEAGTDRTGEMSGSYYITYLDWSFQTALSYDDHIENRNISAGMFFLSYLIGQIYIGTIHPSIHLSIHSRLYVVFFVNSL